MKKFFRSYTYTWQQIGVFKLSMFVIGAAAGAYWHAFFAELLPILIVLGVIGSVYIMYVSLTQ